MKTMHWAAAAALSVCVNAAALAADVSGKWTWTNMRGGNTVTQTAELKQQGEKLTGSVTGRENQKLAISEGTVKGNDVSFVVVRERNGQQFKATYKAKLEGDTLKGTVATTNREGQARSREWVAKRTK